MVTTPAIAGLRAVPLFSGLDDAALQRVARLATEFEAPQGLVLIEIGQAGTGVFVIEEGAVRIELPDGTRIERGPGSFFGELSVLADTPRAGRVIAIEPLRAIAIRREDLLALLEDEPAMALSMLREVARRLAEAI